MLQFIQKQPFFIKITISIFLLCLMFIISIRFGAASTTNQDVLIALFTKIDTETTTAIRNIRLPREVGAIFVGAALAVAGAIMQGITRNPLAEPGLLGLTAGASAMLAITLAFFPNISYFGIIIVCFFGSLLGTVMVFGISSMKKGALSPFRIVLAGAAVSAFLYAIEQGISIYFKVSKEVSMWTAGGLIGTSWSQLQIIIPFILLGISIAILFSRQLTILSLNEEVAIGLGQKIILTKIVLFTVIVMLAGTAVALVGNIAFVGLIIPHIVRAITGTDYRLIIPMTAIIGSCFMLFSDTVARNINAPFETPIIAIVAILGLPFFLMIIRKGGKHFS